MTNRIGTRFYVLPQTWLGRLAGATLAVALFVLAFFFLFVFLLVAGVLIAAFSLRRLWKRRQLRKQMAAEVLEGEFSVEPPVAGPAITHRD